MKKVSYGRIAGVAMYIDGKIESLPAPNRHHDIIAKFPRPNHTHGQQGFLDGYGNFLSREDAMKTAKILGQVDESLTSTSLHSEDLW